jgi:hypothetical protein
MWVAQGSLDREVGLEEMVGCTAYSENSSPQSAAVKSKFLVHDDPSGIPLTT